VAVGGAMRLILVLGGAIPGPMAGERGIWAVAVSSNLGDAGAVESNLLREKQPIDKRMTVLRIRPNIAGVLCR